MDHYIIWFIIIQRWTRRGVCSLFFALRRFETQRCEFVYCRMRYAWWTHISWRRYSPVATTTQIFLRIWYFPRQPASPDVFHQPKHSGMFPEEKGTIMEHRKSRFEKEDQSCQPPLFGLKVKCHEVLQGCRWIRYPCIFKRLLTNCWSDIGWNINM